MSEDQVDLIVVGAGPAGSTAALVAARAGLDTLLIERGNFAGAKNMGELQGAAAVFCRGRGRGPP